MRRAESLPLLRHLAFSDRLAARMRTVAWLWLTAAVLAFLVAGARGGIPTSPTPSDWQTLTQITLLILTAVGGGVAWKWRSIGAAVVTIAAVGLGVLASVEHQPFLALLVALTFYVPGLLFWLDWQRAKPLWEVAILAVATGAVLAAGGQQAFSIYDSYFGPVQPESTAQLAPVDRVEWLWSGGTTDSAVTVKAKLTEPAASVRLLVDDVADLADPIAVPAAMTNDRVASFAVDGLTADTPYWYAVEVEGVVDRARTGRFRTFPVGPASFTFALGSCIATGSNGAVFDTIRESDPLFFFAGGDFFYENIAVDDPARFLAAFDRNLTAPAQAALYQGVPIAYVWDDHDYGGNNADGTSASRAAAASVYRQVVPHYALASSEPVPIYQAFSVGRVRFIVTDTRSSRSPASDSDNTDKTMLGEAQKAWFKQQLVEANGRYPVIVWFNGIPWIEEEDPNADGWGAYATERRELADFIAAQQIRGLVMLSGDAHMLAIDDGTNSDYSSTGYPGFPVMHAGALDRHGSDKGGPYSEGSYPGGGQFGLVTVEDTGGSIITITMSGRNWKGEEIVGYQFAVPTSPAVATDLPPVATSTMTSSDGSLGSVVPGSLAVLVVGIPRRKNAHGRVQRF